MFDYLKYDVVDLSFKCIKPGIPPLLPVALVMWLVCAICFSELKLLIASDFVILGIICAVASLLIVIVAFVLKKYFAIAFVAAAILIGASLAIFGAYQLKSAEQSCSGVTQIWKFTLLEDAKSGAYGSNVQASAFGENGIKANVRLNFSKEVDLLQGSVVLAKASFKPSKPENIDFFWNSGLCGFMNINSYEVLQEEFPLSVIHEIRKLAIDQFSKYGGNQAGLLQALICGYRNDIEQAGDYEKYKIIGLAHLVAVSGAHLAIVAMLLSWALNKTRTPHWLHVVLIIIFILAYLVFTGIPISALRAAIMVVLSTSSVFAKRRAFSLNSLSLCIILLLVLNPSTSVSVSFFLSAGSTLGIVLFGGLISSWFCGANNKIKTYLAEPLGLTLASNLATLPFSASLFSQVSLLAPLSNVAAAPLFSIACIGGLLAACIALAIPALAYVVISIAVVLTTPLTFVVNLLSSVPHASIAVQLPIVYMIALSIIVCLVLWFIWPKLNLKSLGVLTGTSLAFVIFFVFIQPKFNADELIMLDVGQGDAILIRSGESTVLIDTGNQENKLKSSLGSLGVYSLDAVIITHHDDDHMACLESLAGYEKIGAIYCAKDALTCLCDNCHILRESSSKTIMQGLSGLSMGDRLQVGKIELEVVWPKQYKDKGGNLDSVCLLLKTDFNSDGDAEWKALLTGDAESATLEELIKNKEIGDIDVLKVGHHGSKITINKKIAESLRPEISLISVGLNNRYGHPAREALDILSGINSQIYRTDQNGTVKIRFNPDSLAVSTL